MVGHDNSKVTAIHHGGSMDITSYDNCDVAIFEGEIASKLAAQRVTPGDPTDRSRSIDWSKWGALAAWIVIPITIVGILVAVWLDKN